MEYGATSSQLSLCLLLNLVGHYFPYIYGVSTEYFCTNLIASFSRKCMEHLGIGIQLPYIPIFPA